MPEVVQHVSQSYLLYPHHHPENNFSPKVLDPLMETLYVLTVSDLAEAYQDVHGAGSWGCWKDTRKAS